MPAGPTVILIHDAARPFATAAVIDRVIHAAEESGAAVPALPARETVKRVDADHALIRETLRRDEIWLVQTPQGFRRDVIESAAASLPTSNGAQEADVTDDAMLVERIGHPVRVVVGDAANVKITTAEDLIAARERLAGVPRVGTGYDLHRLVEGRPLVLAGVDIPSARGPIGHSDGDVVCHAVIDAMLGAAGAGDIGRHFSNTDPRWKDAAGLDLLARALTIVTTAGWMATSVDVTVVLEQPKLAPHVDRIVARLAAAIGLSADAVSVKGKTNEGVDAVGRGEAIAAHAVAVLVGGTRR
jgi:2-C-methyl-D-erythritol 4-phosphate cytidylyltransferase/2-C-methyl-D-erythritol 2,4-cyclodiphosphate synthase